MLVAFQTTWFVPLSGKQKRKTMLKVAVLLVLCLFIGSAVCMINPRESPFLRGRIIDEDPELVNSVKNLARKPQFAANENPFVNSGFFTVNQTFGGHMYYVFFESKDGNKDAPIIMWLQGGPGCSSMAGLFVELGPYRVDPSTLTLAENPNTWNNHYHLLFVDNPVGAGFSYIDNPDGYVHTEALMATELYSFLTQFFNKYSQYASNDFYVFGESYAGKYVPAIANKIMDEGNKINLKGIGIGDGLTHPIDQFTSYDEFSYANGLINLMQRYSLISMQNQTTELMKQEKWTEAMDSAGMLLNQLVSWAGGVNVYDIREFGEYDFSAYNKYLNLPEVKEMMHTVGKRYHDCDTKAYQGLYRDMPQSIRDVVVKLLNSDLRVMLYNGQFDLIINTPGAEKWINSMKWKYSDDFLKASRSIWKVDGKVAGYAQQYKNLNQVVVLGAGHLSPMNQGENTLDMVTRFIENKPW